MADNIVLNSGTGGATLATDEAGTPVKHYQFVKLVDGTADSEAKIGGDATNGLDVDVTRVQGSVTVAQATAANLNATVSGTVTANLAAGTNNIGDVDVLSVPAPLNVSGAGTEAAALRVTLANDSTGLVSVDDNGGSLTVDNGGTFAVQAAQSGTWNVGTLTSITNTVTVDSELTTADLDTGAGTDTRAVVGLVGTASGGGQLIPGSSTDGLLVNLGANNDVTVSGTVTANAGTGSFTVAQATAANLNATVTGTVTANLAAGTNNIGDVDVLSIAAGDNNIGNVDIVTMPNVTLAAGTNTNEVVGDAAHDAAAAGNPLLAGAQMETMADSAPGTRASTDGDANRLATTDGALFVIPTGPQTWSYHSNGSTALTDASVHAAPGAGLSLYVTDIVCSTGAATALNIFFEEGASTVLGPWYLEAVAGRGVSVHFGTPKKITANTALTVTTSASIAHSVDVTGFIAPG